VEEINGTCSPSSCSPPHELGGWQVEQIYYILLFCTNILTSSIIEQIYTTIIVVYFFVYSGIFTVNSAVGRALVT
jgi:hypothetical protein